MTIILLWEADLIAFMSSDKKMMDGWGAIIRVRGPPYNLSRVRYSLRNMETLSLNRTGSRRTEECFNGM